MASQTDNQINQKQYMEEKIRHLEEENILKSQIINLSGQKINYLEERIKQLESINNNGLNPITNLPINPKFIYMLYNEKKYIFISHRNYIDIDIINNENTHLAILTNFISSNTPVKWIFNYKKQNIASIIFDMENEHKMFNWKIYSNGNIVSLNKNMESLFEIIMIDYNKFYIKDVKSGKFLGNNKKVRDECSYFIELLDSLDEKETERFVFYYEI